MKTITLGRARYTVRDERDTFLSDILKLTGKHKPVKSKGPERRLPRRRRQHEHGGLRQPVLRAQQHPAPV